MSGIASRIQRALGSSPVVWEPAPWGSKNRTSFVRLADGRRVVVQQYADHSTARRRLAAARQLAPPLAEHGVPVPQVLAMHLEDANPWAVFEQLPGDPGYVVADHDLSGPCFPELACDMGMVLRRMSELDPAAFDLPRLWADPPALAQACAGWLRSLEPYLTTTDLAAASESIDRLPGLLSGRPVVVCHGDFGPQNILARRGSVTAVLDLEDARIGDPLLDVAWWAWLVRAHTPAAFTRSWSGFLKAAGVDEQQALFDELVQSLIIARLLETAEAFRHAAPAKYPSWAERLSRTLEWRGQPLR